MSYVFIRKYDCVNDKIFMGIGDWGLGIGNPQSPIPNPQRSKNLMRVNFNTTCL